MKMKFLKSFLAFTVLFTSSIVYQQTVSANETEDEKQSVTVSDDLFEIDEYGYITAYLGAVPAGDLIIPEGVKGIGSEVLKGKGISTIVLPDSLYSIGDFGLADNKITRVVFKGHPYEGIFSKDWISNQADVTTTEVVLMESKIYSEEYEIAINSTGNFKYTIDKLPVCMNQRLEFITGKNNMDDVYNQMACSDPEGNAITYKVENTDIDFNKAGYYYAWVLVSDGNQETGEYISVSVINAVEQDGYVIDENGWLIRYTGSATDLVIPEGVNYIRSEVFKNKGITSVVFPESLEAIEKEAFMGNNIKELIIPADVYRIDEYAFASNDITSIMLYGYAPSTYEGWLANQSTDVVKITALEMNYWGDWNDLIDSAMAKVEIIVNEIPNAEYSYVTLQTGKHSMKDIEKYLIGVDPEGDKVAIEIIDNDVDFNKAGYYSITYKATDQYGQYDFGGVGVNIVDVNHDVKIDKITMNKTNANVGDTVEFTVDLKYTGELYGLVLELVNEEYQQSFISSFGVYLEKQGNQFVGSFKVTDQMKGNFRADAISFSTKPNGDYSKEQIMNGDCELICQNFNTKELVIKNDKQPSESNALDSFDFHSVEFSKQVITPGTPLEIFVTTPHYAGVNSIILYFYNEDGYRIVVDLKQVDGGYKGTFTPNDYTDNGTWQMSSYLEYTIGNVTFGESYIDDAVFGITFKTEGATKAIKDKLLLDKIELDAKTYLGEATKFIVRINTPRKLESGVIRYCTQSESNCVEIPLTITNDSTLEGEYVFDKIGKYRFHSVEFIDASGNKYNLLNVLAISGGYGASTGPRYTFDSKPITKYDLNVIADRRPIIEASDLTFAARTASLDTLIKKLVVKDVDGNVLNTKGVHTHDINFDVPGTYSVTYVGNDQEHYSYVTKKVTIVSNELPTISSKDLVFVVGKGKESDLLNGVSAKDTEDGVLTVSVLSHTVTFNKVGSYTVTYQTVDKDGNVVTATRNVVIEAAKTNDDNTAEKPGTKPDNQKPSTDNNTNQNNQNQGSGNDTNEDLEEDKELDGEDDESDLPVEKEDNETEDEDVSKLPVVDKEELSDSGSNNTLLFIFLGGTLATFLIAGFFMLKNKKA